MPNAYHCKKYSRTLSHLRMELLHASDKVLEDAKYGIGLRALIILSTFPRIHAESDTMFSENMNAT